jgi:hypothetical protein
MRSLMAIQFNKISVIIFFILTTAFILTGSAINHCMANSGALSQNQFNTATAGASSGATIMVDQSVTGGKPNVTEAVTLEWDPNPEKSVTGYKLYYGNASGKYLPPIDVGPVTTYTVNNLNLKKKWFFAVKAYDADGNQSDYSNEVVKESAADSGSQSTSSTAMSFTHDPFVMNEEFGNNETDANDNLPDKNHMGSLDGGKIIAGTGLWPGNGGWIKTLTNNYFHDQWCRLDWPHYNSLRGESRIAKGDIDGDGRDEIIIGMGPVEGDNSTPAGHFQVLDDNYQPLYWGQVTWDAYNEINGETWPTCGDLNGDGKDEILIGLGRGGNGIIELFSITDNKLVHQAWLTSTWKEYNEAQGEVRPSTGDLDGDGKDEIILGFAPVPDNPDMPGGTYEVLASDGLHMTWGSVSWDDYNKLNGETRPVIGDLDGDGNNEVVIGLGPGANGALEIQGLDDTGKLINQTWIETPWWQTYNDISGETRPAVGNLDADKADELAIALGKGGRGWIHLFDDKQNGYKHYLSLQLWPKEYNLNNGSSWIAIQE